MTAKAIQYYLCQDVVDGSAASVSAANPTIWATAADVPDYAYKSLGTIWTGAPTTSSNLENRIVYQFGSVTNNTIEIALFTQPVDSVLFDRVKDNEIGAEETNLVIRLSKPQGRPGIDTLANFNTVQQAELRIRYLLDLNWRSLRKGTPPQIPSTGDKSINPSYGINITWDGYISPPNAVECQFRYRVFYIRAVPRSN